MNSLTDLPIDLLQRIIEETNRLDNHKTPVTHRYFRYHKLAGFQSFDQPSVVPTYHDI